MPIVYNSNFQVGNALTDDFHDHLGVFQFMWASGLISDQTFKMLNILCDFQSFVHSSPQCDKMLDIAGEEIGNIDVYSIFTPPCTGNVTRSNRLMKRVHVRITILDVHFLMLTTRIFYWLDFFGWCALLSRHWLLGNVIFSWPKFPFQSKVSPLWGHSLYHYVLYAANCLTKSSELIDMQLATARSVLEV